MLGNFPKQSQDALIPLGWLEAAQRRQPQEDQDRYDLVAGIDVAGPGEDETVVVVRQGSNIIDMKCFSGDARGDVIATLMPYQQRLSLVNIDSVGIGYYMAQPLADYFPVQDINVGTATTDPERFSNLKAELYWGLRMRFENDEITGLKDEKTIGQIASIRYRHNARGQVVIESKDEARKRGIKSPDRAEAIMLAFAPQYFEQTIVDLYDEERVRISPY